jgi:hypothetical protein
MGLLDKIRNCTQKQVIGMVAAVILGAAISNSVNRVYYSIRAEEYLEENFEALVEKQEKEMGIKHSFIPERNNYYGLPSFSPIYESPAAIYRPEEEDLHFNLLNLQEAGFCPFFICPNEYYKYYIEHGVLHEMGHFYFDQDMKRHNLKGLPVDVLTLGEKIVYEGIAEYFFVKTQGLEDDFHDHEWLDLNWDSPNYFYPASLHLVSPVMDLFGMEGMRYIAVHPPNEEDIFQLQKYQTRILDELAKETGK